MSVAYFHTSFGIIRAIENGGGPGPQDLLSTRSEATNCSQLCSWLETVGYFDSGNTANSKAYFAKCFEAVTLTPLNGKRISFLSQIGSTGIDPDITANIGAVNGTPCKRTCNLL